MGVGSISSAELPCNETFARFLAEELFPRVRSRYNVSADPRLNVIGGSSYGGLAASFFASSSCIARSTGFALVN